MIMLLKIFFCITFYLVNISTTNASRVLELSDKFSEVRRDGGLWFIMFYAPWCGHCKRLDPIWAQVAQSLYKSNVRVGRVDCTRFQNLAMEFGIQGYPTIKFIRGEVDVTYNGDRTREELVNFALRMSGPPVQEIKTETNMDLLKNSNSIFFMYVGKQSGPLWTTYNSVAEQFQPHGFFYSVSDDIAAKYFDLDDLPSVFVHKESSHYFFNVVDADQSELEEAESLNITLHKWINQERFATFPKITRYNMHEFLRTEKYLVLVVVEENQINEIPPEMAEFKDMVESVIRKKRDQFHKYFQFGWIGSPDLANSIAMMAVPLPFLIVLNSSTYHHHIPEDDPSQMTPDSIHMFLESIYNQSAPIYGGNSFPVRLYRSYFEARAKLAEMWYGNPVLMVVLFGLPLGFLSLILYSTCCSDILDAEEEDYDDHEKKE